MSTRKAGLIQSANSLCNNYNLYLNDFHSGSTELEKHLRISDLCQLNEIENHFLRLYTVSFLYSCYSNGHLCTAATSPQRQWPLKRVSAIKPPSPRQRAVNQRQTNGVYKTTLLNRGHQTCFCFILLFLAEQGR